MLVNNCVVSQLSSLSDSINYSYTQSINKKNQLNLYYDNSTDSVSLSSFLPCPTTTISSEGEPSNKTRNSQAHDITQNKWDNYEMSFSRSPGKCESSETWESANNKTIPVREESNAPSRFGVLKLLDAIEQRSKLEGGNGGRSYPRTLTITSCKVCGGEASGFHYGVDSCEGCKGFYRRCLTQGVNNVCTNEEKCLITPLSRNNCQFCRFKKCRDVGMSKEGSRLGRRPKRLKNCELNVDPDNLKTTSTSFLSIRSFSASDRQFIHDSRITPINFPSFVAKTLGKSKGTKRNESSARYERDTIIKALSFNGANNMSLTEKVNDICKSLLHRSQTNPNPCTSDQTKDDLMSKSNGIVKHKVELNHSDFSLQINEAFADFINNRPNVFELEYKTEEAKECDNFADDLFVKKDCFVNNDESTDSNRDALISNYDLNMIDNNVKHLGENGSIEIKIEDCKLSDYPEFFKYFDQDLLEEVKNVTIVPKELEQLKESTAAIIDAHFKTCIYTSDRLEAGILEYQLKNKNFDDVKCDPIDIMNMFLEDTSSVIQRVVRFSKKLPGFLELNEDDQITLIKQGAFEVILTRSAKLFTQDGMFVPDMSIFVPRHIIRQMPLGKFFEKQFPFAESFNTLHLTDTEIALFTASLIIHPDRPNLQNPDPIRIIHRHIMRALYTHMKNSRKEMVDDLFLKIMQHLPQLRLINMVHSHAVNNVYLIQPQLPFPPLHMEVFNNNQ